MNTLAKLQVWTTPLWLLLMVVPVGYLLVSHPESIDSFFAYTGESGDGGPNLASVMLAAGVCLSLMAQIAEQIDYLRFMPPAHRCQPERLVAGRDPGRTGLGHLRGHQADRGPVHRHLPHRHAGPRGVCHANEPVHQFLGVYQEMMPAWLAMTLAVVLVVISQIKINVTNAYSGSLAWTNSFTRITKTYPGRMVFVVVNLLIALVLMEANMFDFLNTILGFYANCAMAWVVTVASDIAINKYLLKISPKVPEFRRGMLYAVNPVGFVSMLVSAGVSIAVFFGAFGSGIQPYSPIFAVGLALVLPPVLAVADPRPVLPPPHRRRHRPAHVRRRRQPQRRETHLPRDGAGVRASGHGAFGTGRARRRPAVRFLARLVHGQDRGVGASGAEVAVLELCGWSCCSGGSRCLGAPAFSM